MPNKELPKGYEPHDVEARWRNHWESNNTFAADPQADGEPYCVVIPPPNVTGALHMGHALNETLQDICCRHARQQGKNVLWVVGTDHAGIATQNVVEKKLMAEGTSREDLGRDAFIDEVWKWKQEYGDRITDQIRKLGSSVDWTRERFTMDEGCSRAVRQVFVRLYEEGLIYQGDYIINWCSRCHTALADDEVEHQPRTGAIYKIRYPLVEPVDGINSVVVATTRPETMLGDTGVAVNPEDERFAGLIGASVRLPLVDRELPIIGDTYVDVEFGTGCLKVTPAHDFNDWELGQRHKLDVLSVFTDEGTVNAHGGPYEGLSIEAARKRVVADLQAQGYLVEIEEHEHSVGQCYRCDTTVEPHVSKQWFVAVKPLAERAMSAVRTGQTTFYPQNWEKTYFNWLENVRDWCISRQIWWGHRIPVWQCEACDKTIVAVDDPDSCPCGGALRQEEDVLDTWFSSALWPFSTLGWPDDTPELKRYYPTAMLCTGFDIIFFWVARMMMMGLHFMDQVPFKHVYIHALVRAEDGRKMSKSVGNVINPLDMIDKYGCDALRFTLAAFAAMGRDIRLAESRIEGYRNFVNKIWNAARFSLMNFEGMDAPRALDQAPTALHHRWILSRLEHTKATVAKSIDTYAFNEAAQTLYTFIWHEVCDWYLELVKNDLYEGDDATKAEAQAVLHTVLAETMVVLHPFMPFISAEVYDALPHTSGDVALTPAPPAREHLADDDAESRMQLVQDVITAVRTIRGELNVAPSLHLEVQVQCEEPILLGVLADNEAVITKLARISTFVASAQVQPPKASAASVVSSGGASATVYVDVTGAIDIDAELARLNKEDAKVSKELGGVEKKLANPSFLDNAPPAIVEKERTKQTELAEKLATIGALKEKLQGMM